MTNGTRNGWLIHEVRATVRKIGNGAHVTVPKSWLGQKVVVRREPPDCNDEKRPHIRRSAASACVACGAP